MIRQLAIGILLALPLAVPATAGAVPDLRVTEHVVPPGAGTGEVVQARVTVTNVGDTPTDAMTEIGWEATNGEGFIVDEFVRRPAVCPPGAEDLGPGPGSPCYISTPIAPGASVTAVFAGSSRIPAVFEARALVEDSGTGLSSVDIKPLTITGPTLPEPPGPRVSRLILQDRRLRPGERARLRFTLDRPAKDLHAALFRCFGRTGCRRIEVVPFSAITRRGRRGPNRLAYRLPARLAPGRYRITVWAYEPFHRQLPRSMTVRVLALGSS